MYKDWIKNDSVWVMGVCGKKLANKNRKIDYAPIYIAKITDVKEMIDYYQDDTYQNRRDHKAYQVDNGVLTPHRKTGIIPIIINRKWKEISEGDMCCSPINLPIGEKRVKKRDFCYIDEICKKNSWFPKEGEAKFLSERSGDEKSGSCSGCQDTGACS